MNKYMEMNCECAGCRKAKKLLVEDVAVKFAEIAIEGKSQIPTAGLMMEISELNE